MDVNVFLEELLSRNGSDLHLQPGDPPVVRVYGELTVLDGEPLSKADTESIFKAIGGELAQKEYREDRATDFAYEIPGKGRFRVSAFQEKGNLAMVFRHISTRIPGFDELNLPPIVQKISKAERGLVLVVGVTGCGKTTTLAAMIDYVNNASGRRIITIENPIEYIHQSKKSIVSQRELGQDATSFASALRSTLRQDPDVILVGELRDLETIRTAIRAAETGHLVFSTMHTNDTVQTLDRMIGHFPAEERDLARSQVALNLHAVIAQRLVKLAGGQGRIPVVEILINNSLVQKLLLSNKIRDLYQVVKNRQEGMQSFDQCLLDLVQAGQITEEESMRYAANPPALRRMLAGGVSDSDRGGILAF